MFSEITVPTCSYRMGELSMGVGTAVVSKLLACVVDTACSYMYIDLIKTFKPSIVGV